MLGKVFIQSILLFIVNKYYSNKAIFSNKLVVQVLTKHEKQSPSIFSTDTLYKSSKSSSQIEIHIKNSPNKKKTEFSLLNVSKTLSIESEQQEIN